MTKNTIKRLMLAGGAASMFAGSAAYAVDFNITGFVRQEIAISVTGQDNPYNTSTNPFLGRNIPNITTNGGGLAGPGTNGSVTGQQFSGKGFPLDNGGFSQPMARASGSAAGDAAYVQKWAGRMAGAGQVTNAFGGPGCVTSNNCGDAARSVKGMNQFNLFATRVELDIQAKWTDELNSFVKIRAYSDYQELLGNGQTDSHFNADFGWIGGRGNLLEYNTPNFMLDIPSAYLDYNSGPLWVRLGQQQIAWGEAYFFRVFDVPNGLDTRRHFTLDVGAEEFSDKRVAAPALRVNYTFKNGWTADTFVQMAAPTTLVGTNTPYNVVASGFSWRDTGQSEILRNNVNYGTRITMPVTDSLTLGLMAVSRLNPDGVVQWADAPLKLGDGSANPFCFGPNNYAGNILTGFGLQALGTALDNNQNGQNDVTELLTPMSKGKCGANASPDRMGTAAWKEWMTYAGKARLNPIEGVLGFLNGGDEKSGTNASTLTTAMFGIATSPNGGLRDPAGARMLFNNIGGQKNNKTPFTYDATRNILDAFFNGFAFPRGYITRQFERETITGASGNYIVNSTPGSWLDQLIIRGELAITPNKVFTALDLRAGSFIEATEVSSALILEKYHNVVPGLPATYLVGQWMHKTQSDLFGRHLSGNQDKLKATTGCLPTATSATDPVTGLNSTGAREKGCGRPVGQTSADYISLAFQQPFPNLIWRADYAMLIDIQGGVLLQPGVKYKPSTHWQVDLYANVLVDLTPKQNDDVVETLDWADEVFARVTYYF